MADHRALLVLAEELEDALGDVDTRVLAEQPIGEGGRVAVGDEADARRLETVLVGDLMDQLMHAGITPLGLRILQEFLPLSQRSVKSHSHGLISQISRLRTTVSTMASIRLTSPMNSMAAITQPITIPDPMPKVTREANNSRAMQSSSRRGWRAKIAATWTKRSQNPGTKQDRFMPTAY